jgi:peptidoglycan/xylan/chitin deacetylase (PgdA/CDA1 family)
MSTRDFLLSLASRVYITVSRVPRLTVVTLHRVGPSWGIQPRHVERCFRFLANYFHVVRPSDLDLMTRRGRTAIVTIDDGHADAYRYVFPIARATGVPISLCIPTDFFFRGQWLWFDKFDWAMHHAKSAATTAVEGFQVSETDPGSFTRLRQYLKRCPPRVRDLAIQRSLDVWGLQLPSSPPEQYRALTIPELREMLSSGLVEIVAHTATHTIATVLSKADLEKELRESREEWESFGGRPIASFCYPSGNPGDFNEQTATAAAKAGYRYAFTQLEGTNPVPLVNPLEIKRVHIHKRKGFCDKVVSGLVDLQNRLCPSCPGDCTADESEFNHS